MKNLFYLLLVLCFGFQLRAQPANCILKPPAVTIHFGTGIVQEVNTAPLYNYRRVSRYCPTDGHYAYTSYTSECFSGDWHTLEEDHTPGDIAGNMMLVNASPASGTFLTTTITGLKRGSTYVFSVWMMNVCKISEKCPYPLLPNIGIVLQSPDGKVVMQFATGELVRRVAPQWTQYQAAFTAPAGETPLTLTMIDNAPGGCGNDFVLDDISFRECVMPAPVVTTVPKRAIPVKLKPAAPKPVLKKGPMAPVNREIRTSQVSRRLLDTPEHAVGFSKKSPVLPAPPPVLITRTNPVIKQIETPSGDITLNLYDNGEIDGDTVSIYHNNLLLIAHARLSEKPISFHIAVDAAHPHHELVMVAENLGSIPPNTSLMVVIAGTKRYEVFISSTEQKNAKVVIDLKE